MTRPHKHATSSVHLISTEGSFPLLGLILHPRMSKWMIPGGHIEPDENEAEAALREVLEETGYAATLLDLHSHVTADLESDVRLPLLISEQEVGPDSVSPTSHIHVDHIYAAAAHRKIGEAELRFEWYPAEMLPRLDMFTETRWAALHLLSHFANPSEWSRVRELAR